MKRNPEESFEKYQARRESAALLLKRMLRGFVKRGTECWYVPNDKTKVRRKTKAARSKAKIKSRIRGRMAKESRRRNRV